MLAKTPCGLDIPQTVVFRLGIAYLVAVGTYRVDGVGEVPPRSTVFTSREITDPEVNYTYPDWLERARLFNRIHHPEVDWLTYHDAHCDCRKDEP